MTLRLSSALRQEIFKEICVHRSEYREEKWNDPLNVSTEGAVDYEGYCEGHFEVAECK